MKKSFTIIELLIVVVIIGVLATIAVPQFINSIERAKFAKAQHNLALMNKGAMMCFDDVYGGNGAWGPCTQAAAQTYVEFVMADADWGYTYNAGGTIGTAARLGGSRTACRVYIDDQQKITSNAACVIHLT